MKKYDLEHTQILKIRPSITTDKNSQRKTQKGRKVHLEGFDDSPFSLFLPL